MPGWERGSGLWPCPGKVQDTVGKPEKGRWGGLGPLRSIKILEIDPGRQGDVWKQTEWEGTATPHKLRAPLPEEGSVPATSEGLPPLPTEPAPARAPGSLRQARPPPVPSWSGHFPRGLDRHCAISLSPILPPYEKCSRKLRAKRKIGKTYLQIQRQGPRPERTGVATGGLPAPETCGPSCWGCCPLDPSRTLTWAQGLYVKGPPDLGLKSHPPATPSPGGILVLLKGAP